MALNGRAMVGIFFVISGYVLRYRMLTVIRNCQIGLLRVLASSTFRSGGASTSPQELQHSLPQFGPTGVGVRTDIVSIPCGSNYLIGQWTGPDQVIVLVISEGDGMLQSSVPSIWTRCGPSPWNSRVVWWCSGFVLHPRTFQHGAAECSPSSLLLYVIIGEVYMTNYFSGAR